MNCKILMVVASVLIDGCSTIPAQTVESWEYVPEPIQVQKRRDQTRSINWLQVPNDQLQQICERVTKGRFGNKKIAGCASWVGNKCTVITGMNTTTSNLGHEIRHCYDYDFHD